MSTQTIEARLPFDLTETDLLVGGWLLLTPLTLIHVSFLADPLPATHLYNALLYLIGVAIGYKDKMVRRVLILATVAGFLELLADYFLVSVGSLVYPHYLASLLSSPLYMPLSWAIAITQIGYITLRIDQRYGLRAAIVAPSVMAMVLIGFYESYAGTAGIWSYATAPFGTIGHAPVYIVVAEGVMFATLIYFLRRRNPVLAGVGFGLVIGASYVLSYVVFSAL